MTKRENLFLWFPVVVWFGLISYLSSIPGNVISSKPSLVPSFIPLDDYLFWGHRLAHVVEYGTYGILVLRACSLRKTKPIHLVTILVLSVFVFLSGCLDEWHQSFVPGRTPELIDALFDTIRQIKILRATVIAEFGLTEFVEQITITSTHIRR